MTTSHTEKLEIKNHLNVEFDRIIEKCLLQKLPIKKALSVVMPIICKIIGANDIIIGTIDENLERIVLKSTDYPMSLVRKFPKAFPEKAFEPQVHKDENGFSIMASLDVVDQVIGICAFYFKGESEDENLLWKTDLVDAASELLDNYLEGIASNARKQSITMFSTEALRSRIFEEGADVAVKHLCKQLNIEEFLLLYGDADSAMGEDLRYRYYKEGEMIHNSIDSIRPEYEKLLENKDLVLRDDNHSFSEILGSEGIIEKALQNGMNQNLIGKLIFKPIGGGLNPESLDIIRIFSECLCQRLFDYNRERRYLAKCFCAKDVQRLLSVPDFYEKYLSPREEDIVILYTDITSFTSICEKVLGNASEIGELINQWSQKILEILYRHDGVFDKMVGDCVIGLFGPPFFESSMEKRGRDAIEAAREIVEETIELGGKLGIEEKIKSAGIGENLTTSNGIHCGPTSVGFFGPNEDYTGFSSAMNHAARLQGHAPAGKVLVTSKVLSHIEKETIKEVDFEGPFEITVKNVSEPLEYFNCVYIDL